MTTLAKIEANKLNGELSTGPRTVEGKAIVARNATKHGIFAGVPVIPGECPATWETHRAGVVESLGPVGLLEVNLAERAALVLWRLQRLARYEAEMISLDMQDEDVPEIRVPDDSSGSFGTFRTTRTTRTFTRADQLRDLRKELRSAQEQLTVVIPARDFCRNWPESGAGGTISAEVAAVVFRSGFERVASCAHRRDDPPMFGSKPFRRLFPQSEQNSGPVAWTDDMIRQGLAHYATFCEDSPVRMLTAVRDALAERAEELTRTVRRLEREVAALVRMLDEGPNRRKAQTLFSADGREERIAKYERHLHNLLTSTLHELERLQARREGEAVPPPAVADVNVTIDTGTA